MVRLNNEQQLRLPVAKRRGAAQKTQDGRQHQVEKLNIDDNKPVRREDDDSNDNDNATEDTRQNDRTDLCEYMLGVNETTTTTTTTTTIKRTRTQWHQGLRSNQTRA